MSPPLTLPPGTRRQIAKRVAVALGAATALAGVVVALLGALDRSDIAHGVLLGHLLAHAITVSWVLGALLTFAGSHSAFMVGTVGVLPVRALVVLAGIYGAVQLELHTAAVVVSLVVTQFLGHGVEAYAFQALARAAKPTEK